MTGFDLVGGSVTTWMGALVAFGVVAASCGGDGLVEPGAVVAPVSTVSTGDDSGADDGSEGDGGEAGDQAIEGPVSVGPAAMDTIQIGSQVWQRTLPMTTGQCFVQNIEGMPPFAVAWGTLDGDDDVRFTAGQNQDGMFNAEVEEDDAFFWMAGPRSTGPDDLVVELDFDALTITGEGTFTNFYTGESAPGAFAFQCEDDGTGT